MEKTEQKIPKGFRQWSAKRRAVVFGAAVLVVVVAVVLYVILSKEPSADVEQTRRTAQAASDSGDYDKALSDLKKVQDQATTKSQKVGLYGDLAAAAANAGEIGEAIRYYGLKHDLDPGSRGPDAYLLATLYERSGDLPEAIAQYNLALEYLNTQPSTPETSAEIEGIQAMLQELEAAR